MNTGANLHPAGAIGKLRGEGRSGGRLTGSLGPPLTVTNLQVFRGWSAVLWRVGDGAHGGWQDCLDGLGVLKPKSVRTRA